MSLADRLLAEANWLLYHYTSLNAAAKIVEDGEFHLIFAGGTEAERNINGKYHYYLSCSRVPEGGYNVNMYARNPHAIFQLDGRKISHRYAVRPVRYWPAEWTKDAGSEQRRKADENEDRILANVDSMPLNNAVALHVYVPAGMKVDDSYGFWKKEAVESLMNQNKLPVFWYDSMAAFRILDTRRAIKPPEIPVEAERVPPYQRSDRSARDLNGLVDWLENPNDKGDNNRRYYYDYISVASADVHNAKSRHEPEVRAALLRLSKFLRKNGLTLAQAVKNAQSAPV